MFVGKLRLTMDGSVGMHHWSLSLISTQLLMIIKWHTNPSPEKDENSALCSSWRWNCCRGFLRWPRDTEHAPVLITPANAQQITVSASSIKSVIFLSSSNHSQHLRKIKKSASANITKTDQSSETPLCILKIHVLVYKLCIIFLSKLNFRNGCNWPRVRNGIFMLTVYTSFM